MSKNKPEIWMSDQTKELLNICKRLKREKITRKPAFKDKIRLLFKIQTGLFKWEWSI